MAVVAVCREPVSIASEPETGNFAPTRAVRRLRKALRIRACWVLARIFCPRKQGNIRVRTGRVCGVMRGHDRRNIVLTVECTVRLGGIKVSCSCGPSYIKSAAARHSPVAAADDVNWISNRSLGCRCAAF